MQKALLVVRMGLSQEASEGSEGRHFVEYPWSQLDDGWFWLIYVGAEVSQG
jgi:hypothetical protein